MRNAPHVWRAIRRVDGRLRSNYARIWEAECQGLPITAQAGRRESIREVGLSVRLELAKSACQSLGCVSRQTEH